MKSQIISKNNGYTLIEIIIVLTILSVLFILGSFLNQQIYNQKSLTQEKLLLVSILQKSRDRAMNNIEETSHGIHIDNNNYILFRKIPYNKHELTNESINRNKNIKITTISSLLLKNGEIEIIFTQLSGETNNTGEIIISENIKSESIQIQEGGLINW